MHQRLFVANFASGGAASTLVAYIYPLANGSAPNSTLTSANGVNGARGILVDPSDDLFIANASAPNVTAYLPPVGTSTTPSLVLTNGVGTPQDLTLDNGLNLYEASLNGGACGGVGYVAVFAPPLSNSSAPAFTFCSGMDAPTGVTFDGVADIWVANSAGNNVTAYSLPATTVSAPAVTVSGLNAPQAITFDAAGSMYVANKGTNSVLVFKAPITNASPVAFAITNGVNAPTYLATDANGALYVSNAGNITIYAPPFSATSAPAITISTGLNVPVGLGIGF
ncbi:MAG: hypothetical protein JO293_08400 [Candidatus Eremiobacteraeota bacterium]|nr:hypothetical protein [Candidatus Eremiobacteraeota bacterium]